MPFRDPRGGNLARRIETEIRERLEEAIDATCLDTVVRVRQTRQLPPPQADSAQDRTDYRSEVQHFLKRLDASLSGLVAGEPPAAREAKPGEDPLAGLMAKQIALARSLPDYWQRFDAIRTEYAAERATSSGEGRGLLRRLFGVR